MKLFFPSSSLLIFLSCIVFAQGDPVARKYSDFIDTSDALRHLSIIASDEFEGRETGKPGAEKAANYLAAQFKRLGLTPPVNGSYFQDVDLVEKSVACQDFSIEGWKFTHLKDFHIKNVTTPVKINTSEIVFLGYGISDAHYDELRGLNLEGKVVLFFEHGAPSHENFKSIAGAEWLRNAAKRIDLIRSQKPALLLAINWDTDRLLSGVRNHGAKPPITINKPQINLPPLVQVSRTIADALLKNTGKTAMELKLQIDKSGLPASMQVKANLKTSFNAIINDVEAVNVLGYLEGSDLREELLVISAHYDHIGLNNGFRDKVFNGADDDGSGTTAILELAEAFTYAKRDGKGPRRSVLFLLVVGEEKGLLGSEWYSDNPVFPLKNTITNLNIDMIGRVDPAHKANPHYCYLIGSDKLSSDLHKISEKANATYTQFNIDYKYNDPNDPERIYYRSDHYNFAKHNIPIIFYFNGVHEDYHKTSDEVSKINFPLMVERAKLVYFTAWDLLNRDKRPELDLR